MVCFFDWSLSKQWSRVEALLVIGNNPLRKKYLFVTAEYYHFSKSEERLNTRAAAHPACQSLLLASKRGKYVISALHDFWIAAWWQAQGRETVCPVVAWKEKASGKLIDVDCLLKARWLLYIAYVSQTSGCMLARAGADFWLLEFQPPLPWSFVVRSAYGLFLFVSRCSFNISSALERRNGLLALEITALTWCSLCSFPSSERRLYHKSHRRWAPRYQHEPSKCQDISDVHRRWNNPWPSTRSFWGDSGSFS